MPLPIPLLGALAGALAGGGGSLARQAERDRALDMAAAGWREAAWLPGAGTNLSTQAMAKSPGSWTSLLEGGIAGALSPGVGNAVRDIGGAVIGGAQDLGQNIATGANKMFSWLSPEAQADTGESGGKFWTLFQSPQDRQMLGGTKRSDYLEDYTKKTPSWMSMAQ